MFEYELIGKVDEPLARDHIVLNCVARKTVKKEIIIENPYKDKDVDYRVETDLINPQGPSSISVKVHILYNISQKKSLNEFNFK